MLEKINRNYIKLGYFEQFQKFLENVKKNWENSGKFMRKVNENF